MNNLSDVIKKTELSVTEETLTPVKNVPLYIEVKERLLESIAAGRWAVGVSLPSEFALADQLGVSQGTVRKALGDLEKEGILERKQGLGTFIRQATLERYSYHFFRVQRRDGTRVQPLEISQSLEQRVPVDKERKLFSGLGRINRVWNLSRIRSIDGIPALIEQIVIPHALAPNLDKQDKLPNALYPFFQSAYGITILKAEESLYPSIANKSDCKALKLQPNTPILIVDRIARDISGRTIELRHSRFHLPEHNYSIELN